MQRSRPKFALDQNFPEPVLGEVLARWTPEIELHQLREIDARLTRGHEDWRVILALHQVGNDGLVTCDDPLNATGLLLLHLGGVGKRHSKQASQTWLLRSTETRPRRFREHWDEVTQRSITSVKSCLLSDDELKLPVLQ